jgi:hypothetical protein
MIIDVTQEHIDRAREESSAGRLVNCCCPVAQGLRALGYDNPEVGLRQFRLSRGRRRIYWLPAEAMAAVRKFDRGDEVEPFSFEVDIGG